MGIKSTRKVVNLRLKPTWKSRKKMQLFTLKSMKIELSTTLGQKSNLRVVLSCLHAMRVLSIRSENELSTTPGRGGSTQLQFRGSTQLQFRAKYYPSGSTLKFGGISLLFFVVKKKRFHFYCQNVEKTMVFGNQNGLKN